MLEIYNFFANNIYLYLCIIVVLLILITILLIAIKNENTRKKIKADFVEAEKANEELEKIDETPKNNELEDILKKMQEDINVTPEDVVKKFEAEQEEKAIISYQELVDNVKAGKIEVVDDEETNTNFVENLNIDSEPIMESIDPVVSNDNENIVTPEMVKEAIINISESSIKEEPKKFKNSVFISPIYGVINNQFDYPRVKKDETTLNLMNTNEYNELKSEIEKQEEFLNALKEFRNNL